MTTENRDEVTVALTEAKTKLAELSLALKDETARADKAETEVVSLRDWKTKRETKDLEERVDLAFETYKDARKLTDADKEAMLIVLSAKPETFEKQYPKVKAGERHLLRNVTETREAPALQVLEGGQSLTETFAETTDRLMREKKISFEAAQNQAFKLRNAATR